MQELVHQEYRRLRSVGLRGTDALHGARVNVDKWWAKEFYENEPAVHPVTEPGAWVVYGGG